MNTNKNNNKNMEVTQNNDKIYKNIHIQITFHSVRLNKLSIKIMLKRLWQKFQEFQEENCSEFDMCAWSFEVILFDFKFL